MKEFTKYIISETANVKEALIALNRLSADVLTLFVVNGDDCLVGTLTDGDVRRKLIEGTVLEDAVVSVMNPHFHFLMETENDINKIRKYRAMGIVLLPRLTKDGKIKEIYNLKKIHAVLPIDVVLMAGGKGERLRPLTQDTPKPLLKVGDKPIIDYNVDRLFEYGIENINVTVNYLSEQIEKHFAERQGEVKINCIREDEYRGTLGAVKLIKDFSNDSILVMNSDLFTNIDIEEFYLYFIESSADMAVAAIPYSVNIPYGIFELEDCRIKNIKEKPTYNYYANSGIYLIKKKLLNLIPDGIFFDATDFINLLIEQNYNVVRFPLMGYWIDIGKPEDLKKAQEFVKHLEL